MSSTTAAIKPSNTRIDLVARNKTGVSPANTTPSKTNKTTTTTTPIMTDTPPKQQKPEKPILSGIIEKRGLDGDWKSRYGILTKRKLELFADEKMGRVYVKIHFRAEDSAFRLRIDQVRMPNQFVLSVIEPHKASSVGPSSTPTVIKKDHVFRLHNEVELRLWFSKIKQVIDRADASKRHKGSAQRKFQPPEQSLAASSTMTPPLFPKAIPKDPTSAVPAPAVVARPPTTSTLSSGSSNVQTSTTASTSTLESFDLDPHTGSEQKPMMSPSQWSHIITDPPDGKKIYAATLDRLVQVLCGDLDHLREPNFEDTFFMTYLSFTTPSELLPKIIEQFHAAMSEHLDPVVQQSRVMRVCIALQIWIREHAEDLDGPELLESLARFLRLIDSTSSRFSGREISEMLNSIQKLLLEHRRNTGPAAVGASLRAGHSEPSPPLPATNIPSGLTANADTFRSNFEQHGNTSLDITRFNSMEVATELTLIESELFTALKTKEFLVPPPNSEIGKDIAGRFKKMVNWVQIMVTKENSAKRRAGVISKLMDIVGCLKFLKNYNSIYQICAALNTTPIRRLARTWEKVPKHQFDELERILELFTPCTWDEPFSFLADEMYHVQPPCVPFFGYYLVRFLLINAEHKDRDFVSVYSKYDRDGCRFRSLVNWQKRRQVALLLFEIRHFQRVRYSAKSDPSLRWLLTDRIFSIPAIEDEAQLLRMSFQLEPPPADEIIATNAAMIGHTNSSVSLSSQSSVVAARKTAGGGGGGGGTARPALSPFRSTSDDFTAAGPPPQLVARASQSSRA